jgi:hypothetical protein
MHRYAWRARLAPKESPSAHAILKEITSFVALSMPPVGWLLVRGESGGAPNRLEALDFTAICP